MFLGEKEWKKNKGGEKKDEAATLAAYLVEKGFMCGGKGGGATGERKFSDIDRDMTRGE